jgi:RNA polymerase sigma-70 factor, ECF subfamily
MNSSARLKSVEWNDAAIPIGAGGGGVAGMPLRDHAGDMALLQRMAARDESALEAFHRRHADALYAVASRMLFSDHDANEVLQDVFLKIWDKASSYDPRLAAPLTWATMLLRSLCLDRMRRVHRYADRIARARAMADGAPLHDEAQPIFYRDLHERVSAAMAVLPELERQCVMLAVFSEMTHEEVATTLGQPAGTVKSRLRRGLEKLRTILRHAND